MVAHAGILDRPKRQRRQLGELAELNDYLLRTSACPGGGNARKRKSRSGVERSVLWPTSTVYGFPVSTFVNIVRLVADRERRVPFTFCDLAADGQSAPSRAAIRFNASGSDHDGFVLYETSAIAAYVDQAF